MKKSNSFFYSLIVIIFQTSCSLSPSKKEIVENKIINYQKESVQQKVDELFKKQPDYIANSFDYPVGKPNAKGYYNAQGFGKNAHLGDDWNAVTGGNSDLGDPIYATANGYVNFAKDIAGGWGNVIRVWHKTSKGKTVESLYAHCNEILVKQNQFIKKGQKIATIGNANGQYYAHLHFEIREDIELPIGGGYSTETKGYVDPTIFIKNNR